MSDCPTCLDTGWIEVDDCTCASGDADVPWGGHEPMCGTAPCPEGCQS